VSEHPPRVADLIERLGRLADTLQRSGGMVPAQWEALRYLSRANRYSRHPGALAAFLGATKGTVSQTVIALERKGLVVRSDDPRDRRSVHVDLTEAGRGILAHDPLGDLVDAARGLPETATARLSADLTALLWGLQQRLGRPGFGVCVSCRFFQRNAAGDEAGGPHRCGLTREPLGDADARHICIEHAPLAA
jgi:DNA-binding MarR family transcriptional regulator